MTHAQVVPGREAFVLGASVQNDCFTSRERFSLFLAGCAASIFGGMKAKVSKSRLCHRTGNLARFVCSPGASHSQTPAREAEMSTLVALWSQEECNFPIKHTCLVGQ